MKKNYEESRSPRIIGEVESRQLSEPASWLILVLCLLLVALGVRQQEDNPQDALLTIVWGSWGFLYISGFILWMRASTTAFLENWHGVISIAHGFMMGLCLSTLSAEFHIIPLAILVLSSALMVTISERRFAYLYLAGCALTSLKIFDNGRLEQFLFYSCFFFLAVIISETIYRFARASSRRLERLEILNKFTRQIGVSLEAQQVINLVNAALPQALEADTYFLGLQEENSIKMGLFYDDGEYFQDITSQLKGTLSGWVVRNRRPLFIPDLRKNPALEDVEMVIVGQERASLSWMGVPMQTMRINGILAVASYIPNAFDRTDMELLENLAQQTALALDNAYHHSEVERQSRLDSLTQVYNHGYFLQALKTCADHNQTSMSLLMIDIDHFKQYNDNYGHLVGDMVLTRLSSVLRQFIHADDPVGRWGGEEFAVLLPNTNREQAIAVAQRIREHVNQLSMHTQDGQKLPFPTVSQGIAVYPTERNDIIKLVDLADQRLYMAKERGRNQIEWG